ncbi:hypothetical protein ACWIUD_10700 [Helicobacter sp. 23-1044]
MDCHDSATQNLAMTKKTNALDSVNRRICLDFATKSQNLNMDGCFASLTKQGKAEVSLSNSANCHDSATQNLTMTKKSNSAPQVCL